MPVSVLQAARLAALRRASRVRSMLERWRMKTLKKSSRGEYAVQKTVSRAALVLFCKGSGMSRLHIRQGAQRCANDTSAQFLAAIVNLVCVHYLIRRFSQRVVFMLSVLLFKSIT